MNQSKSSRRRFLSTSTTAAAGALAAQLVVPRAVRAAGSDHVKVGLVGCGGRGTGAAQQALSADKGAQLTALADLFPDQLERALANIRKSHEKQVKVTPETCFSGFDAYKQLIDSGVDVVLLCSPPGFRPAHLAYAVEKGKHVFTEKPMAVDIPGVHSVLATLEKAREANVSIVAGFCYRYSYPERELFKRVHDGAIGKVHTVYGVYNTGSLWSKPRKPEWTDMEWQIRNWLYFTWLSGDHIVEQHVHNIDVANWVLGGHPIRANGVGGRQSRLDPSYGHIFDHFCVELEYPNGARVMSMCRQQDGTARYVGERIAGTRGVLDTTDRTAALTGAKSWTYEAPEPRVNPYVQEHADLLAAIRGNKPLNEGRQVAESTLTAIMAREAAYTGQVITWDEILASDLDLTPGPMAFGPVPVPPVAQPGVTKLARPPFGHAHTTESATR